MTKRNRLMMVEVFRGITPGTKVYFHRENRLNREYTPTPTSLDRLEPFLKGSMIFLHVDGIMIHKHL